MCVHCGIEDFKTKVKQTIVLVGMVLTFKAFCYVMDWCLCCRLVPSLGILYLTHIPYFVLVRIWVRFDPRPNLMTWAGRVFLILTQECHKSHLRVGIWHKNPTRPWWDVQRLRSSEDGQSLFPCGQVPDLTGVRES